MAEAVGRIARELGQTRPFASTAQEAMLALFRTADVIRRHLLAVVEPHGITLQQFNVLRILRGAGDAGLPTLEIGGRMVEQQPGVTRLLDRLEAKALVRRKRCAEDRRQVLCWITDEGRSLLAAIDGPLHEAEASLMAGLPAGEQRDLIRLLDAVRGAVPPAPAGREQDA